MELSRRTLLGALAAAPATRAPRARGAVGATAPDEGWSLLYDSTLCIGCKSCMTACNAANELEPDTRLTDGRAHAPADLNEHAKTIIKLYHDPDTGESAFVKQQCMHCLEPACATACMLGALKKGADGIVAYDASLCVGCRYCEMACPFNVPKFEWRKKAPKIVKCELCRHLVARGEEPGCTAVCPTGAVVFGKRGELLEEAHGRLAAKPREYVQKVYGETDGGGTQVLALAHVDFTKLGFPDLGDEPVPERVRRVQHTVYQGFVAPIALYAVLAGVLVRNRKRAAAEIPGGERGVRGRSEEER